MEIHLGELLKVDTHKAPFGDQCYFYCL